MDIVRKQVNESRFVILRRNYNVEYVTSPGKDGFVKLMLSSKELFPGHSVIAFLEAYRPMKSNFTYVAENYVRHVTHKQGNGEVKMATVCRLAREEDYEAVANIDTDVYGGLDYLPARFHFYLTSPNHYPFVMEHEGEIVAYMYRYVVDDGNAVIGGAARVRADLRGNGLIYRKLVEFVDKQIASLHPRAVHRRLYVAPNTPIQQNLIKKGKVEVILHRAFTHHCISMDIVRRQVHESRFMILRRNYNVEQVTSPGKDEFVKLMLSSKELFPGDSFIAFLEPYRPMKSNFTYVAENYVCHVTHKQGNGASAVSFLTYVPCKAGLRVDMEVYVTNVNILIQHVLKSLEYLSTLKYECDIQYCVYFPNDLNKQQLEQLMVEELCWKTGSFAKYGTYFALRKILNISQL